MGGATHRIGRSRNAARDWAVSGVHGEFKTLERALETIEFEPEKDRLFSLGDLIDRGPDSAEALAWLTDGRFAATVRGNQEQLLVDRLAQACEDDVDPSARHTWFAALEASEHPQWAQAIVALSIATTVETAHGAIGLVHAAPTVHARSRQPQGT